MGSRGRGLQHPCPSPSVGVEEADGHDDLFEGWEDADALGAALTDPDYTAATTGTGNALGFDHLLDARQRFGTLPLLVALA